MSKKVYTMRELVRAKAKAEKIEMGILKMLKQFKEVDSIANDLTLAAIAMRGVQKDILALPGGVRP